ncbi:MAG: FAD-dependent oxidoreductase [Cyanobacteria bacterium J06621_11]
MSHIIVVGADPAGLSAAYELSRNRYPVTVLEASAQVGGLFRMEDFRGYRIDLGQYGFKTDIVEVRHLWNVFAGAEFGREKGKEAEVRSLIYFRDRLFNCPFSFTNLLKHLGPIDLSLTGLSFCKTWLNQSLTAAEDNRLDNGFEDAETWLKERFGTHLYNIFFASYFHKLWGRSASCLHSDCAIEMVQALLGGNVSNSALTHSFAPLLKCAKAPHPQRGVGQVWQQAQALAEQNGAQIKLNTSVETLKHNNQRIEQIIATRGNATRLAVGDHVVSSLPLTTLVHRLDPPAPANVLAAADCLQYRSLIVVALVLDYDVLFSAHEVHVHSPDVQVSRIQNFKNWSVEYVADYHKTCLGMTYLCDERDSLWQMDDDALVQLAFRELELLRLVPEDVPSDTSEEKAKSKPGKGPLLEMGTVVRQVDAHPVRSVNYYQHKAVVQHYLEQFENLEVVGRHGFETSTAQDASMLSGLMAARNVMRLPSRMRPVRVSPSLIAQDKN